MGKKVIVIGAGVSGLTAAIYARLQGFDTELYESHSLPGGMCTGWQRKGYNIDGCIHWMMGTRKGSGLHRIWETCGALSDDVPVFNHDVVVSTLANGEVFHLYRDIGRMEAELLRIAPEDSDRIREFAGFLRSWEGIEIVPSEKPFEQMTPEEMTELGRSYAPAAAAIEFGNRYTIDEYADSFRSPVVRKLLLTALPTTHSKCGALFTMLATRASGNGGWPQGGSLQAMKRMAARFAELGGHLHLRTKVTGIVVEGTRAAGIRVSGSDEVRKADHIIPAIDAYPLLNSLLNGEYRMPYFDGRFADPANFPLMSGTIVAFGVDADLFAKPHSLSFEPSEPLLVGGQAQRVVNAEHYCFDGQFSPEGRSTVQFLFNDYRYDYWRALQSESEDAYRAEKKRLADVLEKELERLYPETKGKIEMRDVCTPLTFSRYCDAHKGAYMSFIAMPGSPSDSAPPKIEGIDNLYLAGQFVYPDGGLPQALIAGKFAVQRLCREQGMEFYQP